MEDTFFVRLLLDIGFQVSRDLFFTQKCQIVLHPLSIDHERWAVIRFLGLKKMRCLSKYQMESSEQPLVYKRFVSLQVKVSPPQASDLPFFSLVKAATSHAKAQGTVDPNRKSYVSRGMREIIKF
jgi:hypothetical protein